MPAADPPFRPSDRLALGASLAGAVLWLWTCLCYFPFQKWNELRLAPTFMWAAGVNPFPGPHEGPVTTWTYGPVPILLHLPALLGRDAVSAVMIAAVLNLLVAIIPPLLLVRALAGGTVTPAWLAAAGAVLTAAWPVTSLIFYQPDNHAVAFGLIGIALLTPAGPADGRRLWLAASAGALALWSKQNELGPVLAQLAFVGLRHGWRDAARQAFRLLVTGGLLGLLFCGLFGAAGLIFNLFVLPAGFPRLDFAAKLAEPGFRERVWFFAVPYVVLPAILLAANGRAVFRRDSPHLLPALAFLLSLPFNLSAFLTPGGTINSLHASLYLLPSAVLWLVRRPRLAGVAVLAAVGLHLGRELPLLLRPGTGMLRRGEAIARQYPGQVFLPWNPLLTYFADRRFDHTEDGLRVRAAGGRPVSVEVIRAHLPPAMRAVAHDSVAAADNSFVRGLIPTGAVRSFSGEWVIDSWSPLPAPPAR